jgi:hypothetical protein
VTTLSTITAIQGVKKVVDQQLTFELLHLRPNSIAGTISGQAQLHRKDQRVEMALYLSCLFVLIRDPAAGISSLEAVLAEKTRDRVRLPHKLAKVWWDKWELEDAVPFDTFWSAASALPSTGVTLTSTSATVGNTATEGIDFGQFAKAFDGACTGATDGLRLSTRGFMRKVAMLAYFLNFAQYFAGLAAVGYLVVTAYDVDETGWIGVLRSFFDLSSSFDMAALYIQCKADNNANLKRLIGVLRTEMTLSASERSLDVRSKAIASVSTKVGKSASPKCTEKKDSKRQSILRLFATIDVNKDGKLSKQEVRDWIGCCPSIPAEDRDLLFHAIVRGDADQDGEITVDELMGLMQQAVEKLGGISDPVQWRVLAKDKIMWGTSVAIVGTLLWFTSSCLRAFTAVENQRALQYPTALCWMVTLRYHNPNIIRAL